MDLAELEQLISLIECSEIAELTLKQDGARVTLRRTPRGYAATGNIDLGGADLIRAPEPSGLPLPAARPSEPVLVTAPLVGIFRHVRPIVGLGARVEKGQVIGSIEAMKLANDVPSPTTGEIEDLMVEDGAPVEYGQGLYRIRITDEAA